jgi:hypothetical protein
MKKTILALLLIISSCKKDATPLVIGQSYYLKSNIFSQGAYQPVSPVKVDSLYTDPSSGLPYARASAIVNWMDLNQSNPGNKLTLQSLTEKGINWGDQKNIEWYIPQEDLSH